MPKVLVVDDDQDIVFMIKSGFEKNGLEVISASDGYEALKVVKINTPDLMIVDLTMPVMNGWQFCMKVREDEKFRSIPIIVLSGLLANEESKPGPSEPYNILIAKPFDILKLIGIAKKLIDGIDPF